MFMAKFGKLASKQETLTLLTLFPIMSMLLVTALTRSAFLTQINVCTGQLKDLLTAKCGQPIIALLITT